jgi:hypothetical protein
MGQSWSPLNARKPALSGTVLWLMDCTGRSSCWSDHHLLVKSPFAGQITIFCWSNHIFLLVKSPFAAQITICWSNHHLLVKSAYAGQITIFL